MWCFKNVLNLLSFSCYQPSAWSWVILEYRSFSAIQEIPYIILNPMIYYFLHNGRTLVCVQNQWIPDTFVLLDSLRSCVILSSHLCLCFQSSPFPSDFSTKSLCATLHSPFILIEWMTFFNIISTCVMRQLIKTQQKLCHLYSRKATHSI